MRICRKCVKSLILFPDFGLACNSKTSPLKLHLSPQLRDFHAAGVGGHEGFAEFQGAVRFAVDEPGALFGAGGAFEVVEQLRVVGVAGEGIDDLDLLADLADATEDEPCP
jgi:hypothetical protein